MIKIHSVMTQNIEKPHLVFLNLMQMLIFFALGLLAFPFRLSFPRKARICHPGERLWNNMRQRLPVKNLAEVLCKGD